MKSHANHLDQGETGNSVKKFGTESWPEKRSLIPVAALDALFPLSRR
jgi:hypothetical protein